MKIDVLSVNGVFDTGLAAVLDAFATANDLAVAQGLATVAFDVTLVGLRWQVRTNQGFTVSVSPAKGRAPGDWMVVPAISDRTPQSLAAALARPETQTAARLLRQWAENGARIAAACIGTFIAAESGVLDGETATTTWWLAPFFRQRYPRVRLDDRPMLVPSGRVLTAGAALSHMDMALWLIRQVSPLLAETTARYLIVDSRASQSAYAMSDHLAHADPIVQKFERWSRDHLAAGFSLDEAARAVGASKRTLTRRINEVMGRSPISYLQDLRVERAVHLLRTSSDDVEKIAAAIGYADGVTLRNLLRRRLGKGVRQIRGERITPASK
ncbi:MAG TPA: helix-turn-helix domain-containing protein [Bryobacteraceae bacterium]|nr:helix-turn-helix domain-containing protein [Bryobacteraceae bacterium]